MSDKWKNIKRASEDLGSNLDAEQAWERFDSTRKKDRNKILPWWSLGALLLLVGAAAFLLLTNENDNTISHSELPQKEALSEITLKSPQLSQPNRTETQERKEVEKPELTSAATSTYVENNVTELSQEKPTNNIKETKTTTSTKESISNINPKSTQLESANKKITQQVTQALPQTSPIKTSKESKTELPSANNLSLMLPTLTQVTTVDPETGKKTSQQVFTFSETAFNFNSEKSDRKVTLELLPRRKQFLNHSESEFFSRMNITKVTLALESSKHKTPKQSMAMPWQLSLQYAYGLANRQASWSGNTLNKRRLDGETLRENNVVELLFARQFKSGFSISSGLVANQYRASLFEVNQEIVNKEFEDVVVERLTREGATVEVVGSTPGTSTLIVERRRQQHYQYLSIPLNISYDLKFGAGLSARLTIGALYGLYGKTRGVTFESFISQGTYQSLSELPYRQ